jgi:putative transcriptional regulator
MLTNNVNDYFAKLGKNIKNVRISCGYSQQELADKLDISQSQYSKFECGTQAPSLKLLFKLCKITNIDLVTLFRITQ